MNAINLRIAEELSVKVQQVTAAVNLLDEGSTVPFISRYRKEVTGGLDDTQLRNLEQRLTYLRELDDRRGTVLKSIDDQGKLTPQLKQEILTADTKTRLEDLYLPYKQKRRTKAQIAREAGLESLAHTLLSEPTHHPEQLAKSYIDSDKGITDTKMALDGARQILMEQFAEEPSLIGELRDNLWNHGKLAASVVEGKENEGVKFSDYFEYSEAIRTIPSHRILALLRGRREGFLNLDLLIDEDTPTGQRTPSELRIARCFNISDQGRPADSWLLDTARWAWRVKIFTRLDLDLKSRLRDEAEEEAIKVFARNLHDLLLAAPAGARTCIGLDPGLRTGVKVVVVDKTGKLLATETIYPHVPKNQWDQSIAQLAKLAKQHKADLVSIGNGTASRETDKLTAELMKRHPELKLSKIMVSEAGASVYSASELAAKEFPNVDVTLRGAVSIARRLQDPLAELVKIEPKAIGVGQYQHDVNQSQLAKSLEAVVEDCVNAVGVDVNTASAPLLVRVSGLTTTMSENIVAYRDKHGRFNERKTLLKVPRLGAKSYQQMAGFLRIVDGKNPLDASSVHPEAYPVVQQILSRNNKQIGSLIGDANFLRQLNPADYTNEQFGLPTVKDILAELEKPGRDPRPEFKTANFQEGIEKISDLKPDMVLEGVVTNVTNFGAFVDIGVHQDGLVHISVLADKFVKDPHDVVKAGDFVKVKVMQVDLPRKRIGLTMRLGDDSRNQIAETKQERPNQNKRQKPQQQSAAPKNSAMANAFANLKR
jgi:uncharacterized protein